MDTSLLCQILVNCLAAGSVNSLLAMGFGLAFRMERFFNFAHAGVFACAAYAFVMLQRLEIPLFPAALFSIAVAMLLTVLLHQLFRWVGDTPGATPLSMLVVSFAVFVVTQNVVALSFGSSPLSQRDDALLSRISVLSVVIQRYQLISIGLSILIVGCLALLLSRSRLGRVSRAVANDPELAVAHGIDAPVIMVVTLAVAAGMTAVAAMLSSFTSQISPEMGFGALQIGLVTWILGTRTNVFGLALIGYAIGFIQNAIVWVLPSHWQASIILLFVLGYLVVRGQGSLEPIKARA